MEEATHIVFSRPVEREKSFVRFGSYAPTVRRMIAYG